MIIYNVTINIDEDIHDDWLRWMKHVHIPEVMACGIFQKYKLLKVLAEDEGHTYSIQYSCSTMEQLEEYLQKYAPAIQEKHAARYKDKFAAFRTVLKEVL